MYNERSNVKVIVIVTIAILLVAAAVATFLMFGDRIFGRNGDVPPNGEVDTPYDNGENNGSGSNDSELTVNIPNPDNGEDSGNELGVNNEPDPSLTLRERYDRIVWIDAGNGGGDVGPIGVLNGVNQYGKDITLAIALKVYELFAESESGVRAFLSRSACITIPVAERPDIWNDYADLVVSIHLNGFGGENPQYVGGFLVNYDQNKEGNTGRFNIADRRFAQIMQTHLRREILPLGARDRGITGYNNLRINTHSTMPAVLINAGFVTNPTELELLVTEDYQMSIARAIYGAVVQAFGYPRNDN